MADPLTHAGHQAHDISFGPQHHPASGPIPAGHQAHALHEQTHGQQHHPSIGTSIGTGIGYPYGYGYGYGYPYYSRYPYRPYAPTPFEIAKKGEKEDELPAPSFWSRINWPTVIVSSALALAFFLGRSLK